MTATDRDRIISTRARAAREWLAAFGDVSALDRQTRILEAQARIKSCDTILENEQFIKNTRAAKPEAQGTSAGELADETSLNAMPTAAVQ